MDENRFDEFLLNHWPHLLAKVGRLEGMQKITLTVLGALSTLVIALVVLVVNGG